MELYIVDKIKRLVDSAIARTRNEVDDLVKGITGKRYSVMTGQYEGLASIDMTNREIHLNPDELSKEITNILVNSPKINKLVQEKVGPKLDGSLAVICQKYGRCLTKFLIIHEIGHYLYTCSDEKFMEYYGKYCSNYSIDLCRLVVNICEDIKIQSLLLRNYDIIEITEPLYLGQKEMQGPRIVLNFEEYLNELEAQGKKLDLYNQLYYFILRGYNRKHNRIKNNFDKGNIFIWSKDTINAFDKAQDFGNSNERCEYIMKVVMPLVMKDIGDNRPKDGTQDQNNPNGGGSGGGSGSGTGSGSKPSDGKDKDSNQSNNSQDKNGGDSNNEQNDKSKDGKSQNNSNASDSSSDSNNGNGNGAGGGKSNQQQPISKEEIDKVSKELLKKTNNNTSWNKTEAEAKDNKAPKPTKRILENIANSSVGLDKEHLSEFCGSYRLANPVMNMYRSFTSSLQKLYNLHNDIETRLSNGDLDENLITEFYTEKNIDIYQRQNNLVQDKNITVTFILDRSGSMSGGRYTQCINVITALAHAFNDVDIKTSIYLFSSGSMKIKYLDDPLILDNNGYSNLYEKLASVGSVGGTDPSEAFIDLVNDKDSKIDEDTKRVLFFLTDGQMNGGENGTVEAVVNSSIEQLMGEGWMVMCIGIDFIDLQLKNLERYTAPAICKSYYYGDIENKLGEDIYELITENFILIK